MSAVIPKIFGKAQSFAVYTKCVIYPTPSGRAVVSAASMPGQAMKTMHVQLKLFAILTPFTPSDADHYPLPQGDTVGDLARRLSLPPEHVKLIFVNGVRRDADTRLHDGDRVGIFPPVGGG